MVPDVRITLLNFSNIGFIAREESKHARLNKGSLREPSAGFGSNIKANC